MDKPLEMLEIEKFEKELSANSTVIPDEIREFDPARKEIKEETPVKKKRTPTKKKEEIVEPEKFEEEIPVIKSTIEIKEEEESTSFIEFKEEEKLFGQERFETEEDIEEELEEFTNKNKKIKGKSEDFLDNIVIDLNNIEIVEKIDPMLSYKDMDFVLNGSGTYQIIASQSCYIAFMQAFKTKDINEIKYSNLDGYNFRRKFYQLIYSKINTTSLGKITFDTFLKITSFFDLESLLYGIYTMSFPGNTKFDIKCGHCGKKFEAFINNDSLVDSKDPNIYKHFDEITSTIKLPEEALQKSLVHNVKRVILKESKIVVDIQIPTLQDHLNILSSIQNPENSASKKEIMDTLIFVKKMMVLDVNETKSRGKAIYFEVKDLSTMATILNKMSPNDSEELVNYINDRTTKYSIDFKIKNLECPNCKKKTGAIDVVIQDLVFQQILR